MKRTPKRANRHIKIKCSSADAIAKLFSHFSTQLSDGYWENSGGNWGGYAQEYYPDIWNCFNFNAEAHAVLVITLRAKPTWPEANADCEKFHAMKDEEIADYLRTAILDSIEDYPDAFDFAYSEDELYSMTESMKKWEILPPPLPKLTHEELVKIVGHDFEYVE